MAQEETTSPTPATEAPPKLSEFTVTLLVFGLFVVVCVLVWWLATKQAVPGAPHAPTG